MLPLVRSLMRFDIFVRVSIVIILSSLLLPLLPGPADARANVVKIDGQFAPQRAQPGESVAIQIDLTARRFVAPLSVRLQIIGDRGRAVYRETWPDVHLDPEGQATRLATTFTVPAAAQDGDRYVARVSAYYGSFMMAYERSAAELRIDVPVPPTSTPTATATQRPPTETPPPATATFTPEPTATLDPTATQEPTEPAPVLPPSMQLPDVSTSILRVNAGGPAFVDSRGLTWWADTGFSGGGAYSVIDPIAATVDDGIYQSERWGTFSYTLDVPNGTYDLRLLFAEIWYTHPGQRIVSVTVNGDPAITDLDILAAAGRMTAFDRTVPVIVTDGKLRVATTATSPDDGKLSGFELVRSDAIVAPTAEPTATSTPEPTTTAEPSPTPSATTTTTPSPTATPSPTPTATPPQAPTTIQAMVDAAAPNSTVHVPAGTYREKIYINKSITLIADPGVVVDGEDRDRWIVGQADNVTLEGFTFINSNQPQYHGGLSNDGYDNWTISGNTFRDAGNAAIAIKEGSGHLIENNTVLDSGNVGIRVESVGSATIRGNTTEGNNTKNLDPGWEAGGMKITGNYGGVHNVVIENNIARSNNGPGIWVDVDGHDIEIRNNRVYDNTRAGIIYELSFGGRIHGNVVYNNATGWDAWGFGAGIMIQNSSDTEIYDNVVAWNPDGITIISQDRGEARWNNVTGNTIHDNSIIVEHDSGWNTYGLGWLEDWSGVLGNASSNNRGYGNRFWFSTPEGGELRFRWCDNAFWTVSDFSTSPGGQSSVNLTDSQKNQVLANAGI